MLTYQAGLDLNFGLSFHLNPYFVYGSCKGSGETECMHRLVRVFATCRCDKYRHLVPKMLCTQGPCFKCSTVKPVYNSHSKINKTNVLLTNGSLMKVKHIAECILRNTFCNTFDLHYAIIGLENQFSVFELFYTDFTVHV